MSTDKITVYKVVHGDVRDIKFGVDVIKPFEALKVTDTRVYYISERYKKETWAKLKGQDEIFFLDIQEAKQYVVDALRNSERFYMDEQRRATQTAEGYTATLNAAIDFYKIQPTPLKREN